MAAVEGYKLIQVRAGPDIYHWLKEESAKQDRSMNWLINSLISAAMKAQQPQGAQA